MPDYKLVVMTNPVAGQEDAFNAWYDDPHLGDVLTVEGFTAAQRFVATDTQLPRQELSHKYLAIYDFSTDDLDATLKRFLEVCASQMVITPSLAPDAKPMVFQVMAAPKTRDA